MQVINFSDYENRLSALQAEYAAAQEFPHIVIDNFLTPEVAEQVLQAFPKVGESGWIHYFHVNEKKFGLNKRELIPPPVLEAIDALNAEPFLSFLRKLTGISNLIADPLLEGGGIHQIRRGGFLNVHADFSAHPHHARWRRKVNILIYFNKDWQESYGGDLEFWSRDMTRCFEKVAPVFNSCVIFNTDLDSYHGHPHPLTCPENMTRKSLALYYFTEEDKPIKRATNYQHLPEDKPLKRLLIWTDKKVLSLYSKVKSTFGLDDDFASNMLRRLSGKRKK